MKTRTIASTWKSKPTMEGAGVLLKRAFSHDGVKDLDPFLLLDHFGSDRPEDYRAGFPFHPHRGMETITYLLEGEVEHQDSLGHVGTIGPGDVQWMRAGSGIIHQEMPKGDARNRNSGFQLWANLPADLKMSEPRYQDIKKSDMPVVKTDDGAEVRIICGEYQGQKGPARDIAIEPSYLDVSIPAGGTFRHVIPGEHTAFAYVFEGDKAGTLILFAKDGEGVEIEAGPKPMRFLLVSGKPLREPVAWLGPIVMNTHEELALAFRELRAGTFVKHGLNAVL